MPHLSPMNWLLALLSIWILVMLLMSSLYSQLPAQFTKCVKEVQDMNTFNWPWHLQGGRDKQ